MRVDILTALGLSIPAGLNAYIPLLAVALAERFGWLDLREPFGVLGSWWMIAIIAVLLAMRSSRQDPRCGSRQRRRPTLVRPAVGGMVAVAASGSASDVSAWLMVLVGVLLAGGQTQSRLTATSGGQCDHGRRW